MLFRRYRSQKEKKSGGYKRSHLTNEILGKFKMYGESSMPTIIWVL